MERNIGPIKELEPADAEAVEIYGPKRSLRAKIAGRFFEEERSAPLTPEEVSTRELTDPKGTLIHNPHHPHGLNYASHDFRDHPGLMEYIGSLRKAWSDPEHRSHKTLKVLDRLIARRTEAVAKTATSAREEDLDYEVAWRRVGEQDVFIMGFTHKADCYEANRGFYRDILSNAGMLVTEGLQTVRLGYSMQASWSMPEESMFGIVMRDAAELNPQVLFGDNDPRDETEVILDELEKSRPHLPQNYLKAFYAHLEKVSPSVAKKLESVDGLRDLLRSFAHDNLSSYLSSRTNFLATGTLYGPFPHLDLDPRHKRIIVSEERTGLELGGLANRDAVSAWTLRSVMEGFAIKDKNLGGPIIDIQGAQHVDNKVYFFDHPTDAYVNIHRQPQFAFLPDRGRFGAEKFIAPWSRENQEMIGWMVSSGVFDLHPQKDKAPAGFYKTNGFAFARVIDGKMQFCRP